MRVIFHIFSSFHNIFLNPVGVGQHWRPPLHFPSSNFPEQTSPNRVSIHMPCTPSLSSHGTWSEDKCGRQHWIFLLPGHAPTTTDNPPQDSTLLSKQNPSFADCSPRRRFRWKVFIWSKLWPVRGPRFPLEGPHRKVSLGLCGHCCHTDNILKFDVFNWIKFYSAAFLFTSYDFWK